LYFIKITLLFIPLIRGNYLDERGVAPLKTL